MGTQRNKRNDEIVSLGIGKNNLGQFSGKSTSGLFCHSRIVCII